MLALLSQITWKHFSKEILQKYKYTKFTDYSCIFARSLMTKKSITSAKNHC